MMHEPVGFRSHKVLEPALKPGFAIGTEWPISCSVMAALIDMGLSDDKIARYFGVALAAVSALRISCGLDESDA